MSMQYVFYKKAKPKDISKAVFQESSAFNNVLNSTSIRQIYKALYKSGHLLQKASLSSFREYLLSPEADLFKELHLFREDDGKEIVRFIPRNLPVSPYAVALSLFPHAYLSHYSALYLHELTLNVPKPIYVKSRRMRDRSYPPEQGDLTQAKLDSAYSVQARTTKNIYTFDYEGTTYEVYLLEKSAEVDKGIIKISTPHAPIDVPISSIEKTLIECTIKPNYSGGVGEVLNAFRRARGTLKVLRMMQLLKDGHYLFPYEKNILFYMDRAGYSQQQKTLVRERSRSDKKGLVTYLEKNMHEKLLDPDIGIYYPKVMVTK